MPYYQTNAVYERLSALNAADFVWTSGNAWILLYGNRDSLVRLVAFVAGHSTRRTAGAERERLEKSHWVAAGLAESAGLAFATISFDDSPGDIDGVELNGKRIGLHALTRWFEELGLDVGRGHTGKAINDASSSAYHNWQRTALGAIRVSDVDLIHAPETGPPIVYELKRSYLPIARWTPFPADFPNFDLMEDLCVRAGATFRIVYNVCHKTPRFFDDPSRLALFAYSRATGATLLKTGDFEDVLNSAR